MNLKKSLLGLFIFLLSFGYIFASNTDIKPVVDKAKANSSYAVPDNYEPKGFVWKIISDIFDATWRIQNQYVWALQSVQSIIANNIPRWDGEKFVQWSITDDGTTVTTAGNMIVWWDLDVRGTIIWLPDSTVTDNSITSTQIVDNSVTWDDIDNSTITWDNIVNNSITWDDIDNSTITWDNIAENTITSVELWENSVWNRELKNGEMLYMWWVWVNGKIQNIFSDSYDVWIQWSAANAGGNNRNLAMLWVKSNDQLRINYAWEYTWGTRIDGNVWIWVMTSPRVPLEVSGHILANDTWDSNFVQLWSDNAIIAGRNGSLDSLRFGFADWVEAQNFELKMNLTDEWDLGIWVSEPTTRLDVNGKIVMRSQTVDTDANNVVVTKWYLDDRVGSLGSSGNELVFWVLWPTAVDKEYKYWDRVEWRHLCPAGLSLTDTNDNDKISMIQSNSNNCRITLSWVYEVLWYLSDISNTINSWGNWTKATMFQKISDSDLWPAVYDWEVWTWNSGSCSYESRSVTCVNQADGSSSSNSRCSWSRPVSARWERCSNNVEPGGWR